MTSHAQRLAARPRAASALIAAIAVLAVVSAGCAPAAAPGPAETGPAASPAVVTVETVASGFELPVSIRALGDDSQRLLIVEQRGTVRVLHAASGDVQHEPVLDLRDVVSCCGEQGLLDVAPHPRVAENGWVFVSYTDREGATTVARYSATDRGGALRLDPSSRRLVIAIDQPGATHNGGGLAFGPDDTLYVGVGDGHFALVARRSARRLDTLLGSLLRIDVSELPYRVPDDNPLRGVEGARPEIWAYGLRNPWRFSIDAETHRLFVADVGQNAREEINVASLAADEANDFGWPAMEGPDCRMRCADGPVGTLPVLSYGRDEGCAVTGGVVYRGAALAELVGDYLYGDFCRGTVWVATEHADGWNARPLLQTEAVISSFGVGDDGEIYLADYGRGDILRLAPTP